jgi:peptidoglycan/LPS O-acetylase OafA/YrhL
MTAATYHEPSDARETKRGLDVVRGLAAVCVLLGHSREVLFRAQGIPVRGTGLEKALLAPTTVAQEAVAVFFVLSGYLVGGQVVRHVRGNRFSWREYLAKRLSRLWTVLLPGLVATAVVDALTRHWFLGTFEQLTGRGEGAPGVRTATCNVEFLQRARCDPYGSNDSLWSLSYEFWFYILFAGAAVALAAAARRNVLRSFVGVGIVVFALSSFGFRLLWLLPAWLLGVCIAEWERRTSYAAVTGRFSLHRPAIAAALLLVAVAASNLLNPTLRIRFLLVGLGAAPLILALARHDVRLKTRAGRRLWQSSARLGPWSYSLYVFHLPIVVLGAAVLRHERPASWVVSVVMVYGVALVVMTFVYPLSLLTERHTPWVRDRMLRFLGAVQARRPSRLRRA